MLGQRTVAQAAAAMTLGIALVAGGCSTDRKVTEPDPVPVTVERLEGARLTAEDLGASFTASEDGTSIATEIAPEHECDDALADLEPREESTIDFTGSGTTFTSTVAWFPGAGGAAEQVFRDAAEDCGAVVVPDEDLAIRTTGLDFGVLSDDTLALKVELELASGAIEERDVILMREGDLISLVRLTGPRPSDKELLDRTVRTAIGRLGLLADETT